MTAPAPPQLPTGGSPRRPRRRHRLRWILAGLVVLVLIGVVAVAVTTALQPAPAPLALPTSAAAPVGPLEGTWQVGSGSVAGFRLQQTVLGLTSDVVGRSTDVTGSATVAGGEVTAARVRINLLALTSGGKAAPQFGASLDTQQYPDATVVLDRPVALGAAFASGAVVAVGSTVTLTLHGVSNVVTVPLAARRDAATLRIAGSIPVSFAAWGITRPKGYGALGSLADHGQAEFLLVLQRG